MGKSWRDELAELDENLARYYESLIRRKPGRKLTKRDAYEIFEGGLMDGDSITRNITRNEVRALALLVEHDQFDDRALRWLAKRVAQKEAVNAMIRGRAVRPLRGSRRRNVEAALAMPIVGKIDFVNPVTMMSYSPCHYQVIRRLIADGDIDVYEFERGEIDGFYSSPRNLLVLFKDPDRKERIDTIVHESTHAVADWRDYPMKSRHGEADAFVAGAVAYHAVGGRRAKTGDHPTEVAFNEALPLVLSGAARSAKNRTWIAAHKKVVEAVERTYPNPSRAIRTIEDDGPSEKAYMREVWKSLQKTGACKVP